MAYSDIQNKVGQIQMANRVLLAQRMNPNLTPETDLSGFQEQGGYAPDDDDVDLRDFEEGKSVNEQKQEKANERKQYQKNRQANKEAKRNRASSREAAKREWERRKARGEVFGDMPPDFNLMETLGPSLNKLLQIGGAVGGGLRFLANPLGNAMASTPQDGRAPTRLFYNPPYDNPKIFIKDKQTIEDAKKRFKWNTGIDLANTRGYQVTGNGNFVDPAGRVFQNIDGKLIYEGNYDEAIHGELIPPTEQANQSMQINPLMANFPYEFEGGVVTPRYFTPPRYRQQPFLHIRTKDITDEELFHFNNFIRSMGGGFDTVRRQTPLSIG